MLEKLVGQAKLTTASVAAMVVVVAATTAVVAGAPAAQAGGCDHTVWAPPAGGKNEDKGGTSIWGSKNTKVKYRWTVQGDIGKVNIAVMGYDENLKEYWQYTGLWNSGSSGSNVVKWGPVASVPRIRVQTPPGPFPGVMVDWSYC